VVDKTKIDSPEAMKKAIVITIAKRTVDLMLRCDCIVVVVDSFLTFEFRRNKTSANKQLLKSDSCSMLPSNQKSFNSHKIEINFLQLTKKNNNNNSVRF